MPLVTAQFIEQVQVRIANHTWTSPINWEVTNPHQICQKLKNHYNILYLNTQKQTVTVLCTLNARKTP